MGALITVLVIAGVAVILAARGLLIVRQGQTIVVERLGRYHRTLDSGIHFVVPFLDRPRQIAWRYVLESGQPAIEGGPSYRRVNTPRIDLREQIYDFPRQSVITKDNVSTEINAMIYFQIIDAMRSVYEIADLPNAIEKLTQTSLRNLAGEMDLDELLSSRDKVNTSLRQILDDATDKWGVKVNRVEIQDITPPPDIRGAMEKQMRAERDKRASVLTAEGAKQAAILEAEGRKESAVIDAEGAKEAAVMRAEAEAESRIRVAKAEAAAIRMVTEALGEHVPNPANYLISERYIEAMRHMADQNVDKVIYMPYEAAGLISSLGGVKELFASTGQPAPQPRPQVVAPQTQAIVPPKG
ncbi:MAG TPA: SPFH domain-containing protein [Longimicrobiaceae bacterium]|nr:SPFH domain-containing protein [Longimicrobiaceae bacterium]